MLLLSVLILLLPRGLSFSEFEQELINCSTRKEAKNELLSHKNNIDNGLKCFIPCILENQEFISNGKIIRKELSNKGLSRNQKNTCLDIQDDNRCELGYKYYQCIENPKNLSSLL